VVYSHTEVVTGCPVCRHRNTKAGQVLSDRVSPNAVRPQAGQVDNICVRNPVQFSIATLSGHSFNGKGPAESFQA
ncbi:MAG: hypothetical protein ABGX05_01800, partial [Pirellulaceae bacterium]